jgi:hypothetical protein
LQQREIEFRLGMVGLPLQQQEQNTKNWNQQYAAFCSELTARNECVR